MARAVLVVAVLLGVGSASAQDYVTVERRASPGGIVLRDAVSGAVAGAAVGGGIILYEKVIQNNANYDWGRTLAWGTVIGLGVGLVWGIVDATSAPRAVAMQAPRPVRDGLSRSLDLRPMDRSGLALAPVWQGRF
jgi:hypothetical protein